MIDDKWSDKIKPYPSSHIRAKINNIYHNGIYISDEEVIHYFSNSEFTIFCSDLYVMKTDLNIFCAGNTVEVRCYDEFEKKTLNDREYIINSARDSIGLGGYDHLFNNCEHFCYGITLNKRYSDYTNHLYYLAEHKRREDGICGFLDKFRMVIKNKTY